MVVFVVLVVVMLVAVVFFLFARWKGILPLTAWFLDVLDEACVTNVEMLSVIAGFVDRRYGEEACVRERTKSQRGCLQNQM